jgi:hypothetical protein
MKMKLDSLGILKKAGLVLVKARGFIALVAIIGLLGYGGYLASKVVNLQPDQTYLTDQRQQLDQAKISFDKQTIQTINNLEQVNPTVDLSNIGKSDPFSPTN